MKHAGQISSSIGIALLAGLLLSSAAIADCAVPKGPDVIPDGKTAPKEDMVEAMKAFKQYNTDVDAFAECLKAETKTKLSDGSVPGGQLMQFKSMQSRKEESAREELKTKVEKFNEQVKSFKARG